MPSPIGGLECFAEHQSIPGSPSELLRPPRTGQPTSDRCKPQHKWRDTTQCVEGKEEHGGRLAAGMACTTPGWPHRSCAADSGTDQRLNLAAKLVLGRLVVPAVAAQRSQTSERRHSCRRQPRLGATGLSPLQPDVQAKLLSLSRLKRSSPFVCRCPPASETGRPPVSPH